MKTPAFAIALMIGGAAFAQPGVSGQGHAYEGDGSATAAFETEGGPAGASVHTAAATAAGGAVVEPGNSDPELDARGIAVISAAAVVPAGWNGTAAGAAMGGPELDPATGEAAAGRRYPACTASVTDRCVQTYERGRR